MSTVDEISMTLAPINLDKKTLVGERILHRPGKPIIQKDVSERPCPTKRLELAVNRLWKTLLSGCVLDIDLRIEAVMRG